MTLNDEQIQGQVYAIPGSVVKWNIPEPSGWEALLTPGGCVTFRPPVGNVPNWFHRQMQRLCFGIVWRRVA
jgi:hypothetical protein